MKKKERRKKNLPREFLQPTCCFLYWNKMVKTSTFIAFMYFSTVTLPLLTSYMDSETSVLNLRRMNAYFCPFARLHLLFFLTSHVLT